MTREEKVKNLLTELIDMIDNGSQRDLDRADEIGTSIIELLEQEPIGDLISRQAVIYYIKGHIHEIITESGADKNAHTNSILRALINGVETMPPVNPQEPKYCARNICMANEYNGIGCDECEVTKSQEPCGDAISRQAVLDEINRIGVKGFETYNDYSQLYDFIDTLSPVKPQPCEDAISREAVLEAVSEGCQEWRGIYGRCEELINELPSVTQKSEKWIPVSEKLPSDCNEDWVLAQIQEDNGYLWIPCVAEYRKDTDDWYSDANDIGWLKNHRGFFKVIAWMPLPKPYDPQEGANK